MQNRLAVAAAIAVLTLLTYFQFPGHTYLGSDTQIYVPMLERIWDPTVLSPDLVATQPHLSFTLYDEITIALRWLTRTSFRTVLVAQQLIFRACEILGVYLLALSFPLSRRLAMLVAAIFSLGATIVGPAVLVFEYEPVPRGFAIGLVFLAVGLVARNRMLLAAIVAALAFLYHPPTVWVFWLLYFWLVMRRREYRNLLPLAAAVAILLISARFQAGGPVSQEFFARVSPEAEILGRMRAGYNWVTTWSPLLFWQYIFLWIVSMGAYVRVKPQAARSFVIGMPAIGIVSMPLSFLLLEKLKWALIPQFQPARALLYVSAFAMILAAAAAIHAAESKRWFECFIWFALALSPPSSARLFQIDGRQILVDISLSILLALALTSKSNVAQVPDLRKASPRSLLPSFISLPAAGSTTILAAAGNPAGNSIEDERPRSPLRSVPLALAAILPFFALPYLGQVRNYPVVDLSTVNDLARYAKTETPKDAVFLFADAGQSANPSIFRAESLRAVYVDWKSGGQMNYRASLGAEWWRRWQETNSLRFDPSELPRLRALGVDYLVLSKTHAVPNRPVIYENAAFVVYTPP